METHFADINRRARMQFKNATEMAAETRPGRFKDISITIIKLNTFNRILPPSETSTY